MAKPRDYKAEYARRVRSAEARGLSRSQARGHPRKGEPKAITVREALATIARKNAEGRLRQGEREYEGAIRVIFSNQYGGFGSTWFDNQAEALAELLGSEKRYAYSVLLGSP